MCFEAWPGDLDSVSLDTCMMFSLIWAQLWAMSHYSLGSKGFGEVSLHLFFYIVNPGQNTENLESEY